MVLFSLSKLRIFKYRSNIQSVRKFGFETSNQVYSNHQHAEKKSEKCQILLHFGRWIVWSFSTNFPFLSLIPIISHLEYSIQVLGSRPNDSIQGFGRLQNNLIGNYSIVINSFESFKICLTFLEKRFCVHQSNLDFRALYQYLIIYKISFVLLQDFQTDLQEIPV